MSKNKDNLLYAASCLESTSSLCDATMSFINSIIDKYNYMIAEYNNKENIQFKPTSLLEIGTADMLSVLDLVSNLKYSIDLSRVAYNEDLKD